MLPLLPLLASAQPPECPFGVDAHQASDAALQHAADAGLGWVRVELAWYRLEPQEDLMDWGEADRLIDGAVQRGLNVYATVGGTPAWAASTSCDDGSIDPADHCQTRLPTDDAEWEELVQLLAERYGDRVKHWGFWDQPNLASSFVGSRQDWIDHLLVPGATRLHLVCADCKVVGPDLANVRDAHWDADQGECSGGDCDFNGWDYSLGRILQDAGQHLDVVSHHLFRDPAQDWWLQLEYGESLLGVQFMHGVRELTDAYAPGKPVWVTALGWETAPAGPYTESYAATQLTAVYAVLPQVHAGTMPASPVPWPEMQGMFWYDLVDEPGSGFGLLDASLAPKPTLDAYRDTIELLGGCEAFAPGGGTTTGPTETGGGTTTPTDGTTTTPTGDTGPADTDVPEPTDEDEGGGCGCASGPAGGLAGAPLLLGLVAVRWRGSCRRRSTGV